MRSTIAIVAVVLMSSAVPALFAPALAAPASKAGQVMLNPQPEPPGVQDRLKLNPQPEPPGVQDRKKVQDKALDKLKLNPQPEPPGVQDSRVLRCDKHAPKCRKLLPPSPCRDSHGRLKACEKPH